MLRGFWLGVALLVVGCGGAEGAPDEQRQLGQEPTNEAGAAGSPAEVPAPVTPVCEAGRQVECPCPNGGKGAQACAADGSKWEECQCADVKPPAPEKSPAEACEAPISMSESICPTNKPVSFIRKPCLDPYLESGVCSLDLNLVGIVCCPTE